MPRGFFVKRFVLILITCTLCALWVGVPTYGGLKGASDSLGQGSSGRLTRVLRTKFWSSVRAADDLTH